MAVGYDGKPITGYMGVYLDMMEKFKANDPSVTKDTFVQLSKDLEAFRDKNGSLGFGQKAAIEGASASLGFPDITPSEAQAMLAKMKIFVLKD